MAEDTESVAEQVAKLRESWNPPARDVTLERVVGTHPPEGDGRATGHVPMDELNRKLLTLDEDEDDVYEDDGDDVELKGKALDEALEERGLPKTGTADEKRDRVAAYDAGEYDDEEEEE